MRYNIKSRPISLLIVLAKKAQDGELKIIESFDLTAPKTKAVAGMIKKITSGKSALILLEKAKKDVVLSVRNLKNVKNMISENLNAYDLLSSKNILMEKNTLEKYGK